MVRLEFVGLESPEELKKVINALLKKEEYKIEYTKDGEKNEKVLCKNGRLYLNNNYSISLSQSDNNKLYIGVDYFSSEDRIKLSRDKPTTTDVF